MPLKEGDLVWSDGLLVRILKFMGEDGSKRCDGSDDCMYVMCSYKDRMGTSLLFIKVNELTAVQQTVVPVPPEIMRKVCRVSSL